MDMICNAPNTDNFTTCRIDKLPNIGMQPFQVALFYFGTGGLDMEYDMQIDFTQ